MKKGRMQQPFPGIMNKVGYNTGSSSVVWLRPVDVLYHEHRLGSVTGLDIKLELPNRCFGIVSLNLHWLR